MPLFRYEVADRSGKTMMGAMEAASESDVRNSLASRGYTVNFVVSAGPAQPQSQPRQQSAPAVSAAVGKPGSRLSAPPKELAVFFRGMASYLHAGVSIYQSLSQIAGQTPYRGMRMIAERMAGRVQAGEKLSDSMTEFPRAFPPHVIGVVAAGEMGGFLSIVIGDIALDYELAQRASSRIGKIIARLLWINIFGLLLLGPAIPFMIRGLFSAAEMYSGDQQRSWVGWLFLIFQPYLKFTLVYILPPLLLLIIAYEGSAAVLRKPGMRGTAHKLLLRVPWAGRASRERSLAGFTRVLWRLQSAGLLPIQAWDAASRVVENIVVASRIYAQLAAVRAGVSLSQALAATGLFSSEDQRVLAAGEMAGQMTESLGGIAAHYEDAAMVSAKKASWLGLRVAILATVVASGVVVILATYFYFNEVFNGVEKFMGTG